MSRTSRTTTSLVKLRSLSTDSVGLTRLAALWRPSKKAKAKQTTKPHRKNHP